ncbi:MAG: histidine kinase [Cellvibrio sp.]|uniref:sensor histidine kinase n=1 Tax=Cellvibrio sp. TaxID=1965322 RepID=UPI002716646F|nr:histidine kinase [Cellvibrio sp.]
MHPILSRPRRLLWYVLAWIIPGILLAWALVAAHSVAWNSALFFALPAVHVYGFILTSSYYVCLSLPIRQRTAVRVVAVFGGASLLSSLLWVMLCVFWSKIIGDAAGLPGSALIDHQWIILLFVAAVLLYLVSLLAHDVFIAFDNIRSAERHQIASQLQARDAELQMLRSQINPHFLFNSLNSISALTSLNAAAARDMAIELGSFYRKTLALSEQTQISLGEEVELCQYFLAIEKIRFGEKLQVSWAIDPATLTAQVPAMFMQPLIENAIKHGICNLSDGGVIQIKSVIENSWLHIAISNPVDPESPSAIGTATGLKNFKARIHTLYQERARISWYKAHNNFYLDIIIPFEPVMTGSRND